MMTENQDFAQWEELLAGYVLGDLSEEEMSQVQDLLASHPELVNEVNDLRETLALLPLALPETSPPPSLSSQILQKAQTKPSSRKRYIKKGIGTIVAALIIGLLGLFSYKFYTKTIIAQGVRDNFQDTLALLRQPNNRLINLQGTNDTPSAYGSLLIVPNTESAVLTLENLPPLPSGKVYRLWAIANGKKINCFDFNPNLTGEVLKQVPLDEFLKSTSSVVITIEPSRRTSEPTGETVMTGSIAL